VGGRNRTAAKGEEGIRKLRAYFLFWYFFQRSLYPLLFQGGGIGNGDFEHKSDRFYIQLVMMEATVVQPKLALYASREPKLASCGCPR
jgi:hypothetical protein